MESSAVIEDENVQTDESEADSHPLEGTERWEMLQDLLDEKCHSDTVREDIEETILESYDKYGGEFANTDVLKTVGTHQKTDNLDAGVFGQLSEIDSVQDSSDDDEDSSSSSTSKRRSRTTSDPDPYSNTALIDRMKTLDSKMEYESGDDGDKYVDKGWLEDGFVGVKRFLNRKPDLRKFFFYIWDKPRTKEEVLDASTQLGVDEDDIEEFWDDFSSQWHLELHGWGFVEADEDDMPDDFEGDMDGRMKIVNLTEAIQEHGVEFTNNFDWSEDDVETLPFS